MGIKAGVGAGRWGACALGLAMLGSLASCGGSNGPGTQSPLSIPATARLTPAAATLATLPGTRSSYTITRTATGYNVRNNATGANTAVGTGVNLKFDDVTVNLGMGDAAGTIAPESLRTLTELYVAFFNRVPDADGLSYWISQFNAGQSIEQIAGAFYAAALQFSSTTGYTASMTNADFVKIVYKNVLGRSGTLAPPDADVQYWANQLATGAASRGTLVNTMLSAAHNYAFDATWSWVSRLLDNKVSVANYFAVQQGLTYNTPEDSINKTVAIAALVTQTGTTAAVAQVGVSDTLNLTAGSCAQGVATGFSGDIETTAANAGSNNSDTGGSGGGSGGGGSGGGGGLGKVLGGLIRVTDLSTGAVVGQAITDQNAGLVTIKTCNRVGPFLMTLEGQAGAKYFDEGLNALTDFGPGNVLNALVDNWNEHVGVSPLTEAAYRYALNNFKQDPAQVAAGKVALASSGSLVGLSMDQVRLANKIVLDAINAKITDKFQLSSVKALPTPIAPTSTNALTASKYGLSAAVNGGLVLSANQYNPALPAPALSLSSDLARDLTDGRINGFALDGSQVTPSDKTTYDNVRLPLGSMIGANAITQRFGAPVLTGGQLTIDEESLVFVNGSELNYKANVNVNCAAFVDDVALMSDGSVTILRRKPTNVNGVCSYTFSAAENAGVVKIKRFITDVKLLSKGGEVVFAVKNDGTVVGWGENYCGRLSPTLPPGLYSQPQVIDGLRDITSIATTWADVIARDKAGAVYLWSFSGFQRPTRSLCGVQAFTTGQQFNEYRDNAIAKVTGLNNISEVYTESNNYFALTTDGLVYGWGEGLRGLLANSDGTVLDGMLRAPTIAAPALIPGLTNVRQLGFNGGTAYALLADGSVMAWGNDEMRLLGAGVQKRVLRPTRVDSLSNIDVMVATLSNGDGLRFKQYDGTLLAWGNSQQTSFVPVVVKPAEPVRYMTTKANALSIFFSSGKVGRSLTDTFDQTSSFR